MYGFLLRQFLVFGVNGNIPKMTKPLILLIYF